MKGYIVLIPFTLSRLSILQIIVISAYSTQYTVIYSRLDEWQRTESFC